MKLCNDAPRRTFRRLMAVGLIALAVLAGCKSDKSNPAGPPGGESNPPANEVWMQNARFNPATLTISSGTTIRWVNKDAITHTVTSGIPGSPSGVFNSGNIAAGDSFSFTFTSTHTTYHYYCMIHPTQMQATIVVQ